MRVRFQAILLLVSAFLLAFSLTARGQGGLAQSMGTLQDNVNEMQREWLVAGRVKTVKGMPVRGAVVTISTLSSTATRLVPSDVDGEFKYQFSMIAEESNRFSVI